MNSIVSDSGAKIHTDEDQIRMPSGNRMFQFLKRMSQEQRFWFIVLLCAGVFVIPYLRTLWRQELYQYFPFVFLGVGFLFYTRWDRVLRGPRNKLAWSGAIFGAFLLLLAAGIHSTWIGNVGAVLLAVSFLYSQTSVSGSTLGYLALPMVMLIRMPQLHAQSFVSRLRKITTELGGLGLDLIGVPNDTYSNVIHLPDKDLFVAEACSGIQSAFTMVFVALLVVVWRRRAMVTIPVYVIASLLFAIVGNTFRVVCIAVAHYWGSLDWSEGWQHDAVGYVSLGISAGLLLSFDSLAELVLHPVITREDVRGVNPFAFAWNWFLGFKNSDYESDGYGGVSPQDWKVKQSSVTASDSSLSATVGPRYLVLGMVAVASVFMLGGIAIGRGDSRPILEKDALLFDPPEGFLSDRLGVLMIGDHQVVRNGADPQLGLNADVWTCGANNNFGRIAMSQPFVGWHELCVCYEVQDWTLEQRYNLAVDIGEPVAVGEFSQGEGMKGYLIFTAIDTDGSVPTPPSYTVFGRILAPFIPLVTDDFAETSGSAQTIMLQLWTVTNTELEAGELRKLADSIAEVREKVRKGIVEAQ